MVDDKGYGFVHVLEQSSTPPVTSVHPPEEDGKRRPFRSFSAKPMVVQVLPTPLSLKPTPPLNLEDDILVDVENRD